MGFDGESGGMAAGQGGEIGNFVHQGRRPHAATIIYGLCAFGSVQDEGDVAIFDLIHNIWAALIDLIDHGAGDPSLSKKSRGSSGGGKTEPHIRQTGGRFDQHRPFVVILDG